MDLLEGKRRDGVQATKLRVDGGMVANDWFCGFLADVLNITVERPERTETTALGAAFLAGLQVGIFDSLNDIKDVWKVDQSFEPRLAEAERKRLVEGWHQCVKKVKKLPKPQVEGTQHEV